MEENWKKSFTKKAKKHELKYNKDFLKFKNLKSLENVIEKTKNDFFKKFKTTRY